MVLAQRQETRNVMAFRELRSLRAALACRAKKNSLALRGSDSGIPVT
jgi:hypothetical protein